MPRSAAPGKDTENQKGRIAERKSSADMEVANPSSPLVDVVPGVSAQHIARQRGPAAHARPRSTSHDVVGNHDCPAYLHGNPGVAGEPGEARSLAIEVGRAPARLPMPAETPVPTCCRFETRLAAQH